MVSSKNSLPFEFLHAVQAGEAEKQKSYTAVCQLPSAVTPEMVDVINNTKDLELHQQTPVRVSHRRADLVRLRTIFAMDCKPVPGTTRHITLQLRTQVGFRFMLTPLVRMVHIAIVSCKAPSDV